MTKTEKNTYPNNKEESENSLSISRQIFTILTGGF